MAALEAAGAPTPAGRTKSLAATFAPPQGLQGLQPFFAAHGLHGLQALAAQGLHGLHFFAAHGLHGLHALAAHGLQGLHFFAAHGLQGLHVAASIRVGFLAAGGFVAVDPAISTWADETATIPPSIAATMGLRLK